MISYRDQDWHTYFEPYPNRQQSGARCLIQLPKGLLVSVSPGHPYKTDWIYVTLRESSLLSPIMIETLCGKATPFVRHILVINALGAIMNPLCRFINTTVTIFLKNF